MLVSQISTVFSLQGYVYNKTKKIHLTDPGEARGCPTNTVVTKGLQRQHLTGSVAAGFNHARKITKTSATGLDRRQDDYNKVI